MNDPLKEFGKRLRMLRKHYRYSQESLALACGLDRTYIGGIERGERNISLRNMCKIAEVLELPVPLLVDFDSEPPEEGMETIVYGRQKTKSVSEEDVVDFELASLEQRLKRMHEYVKNSYFAEGEDTILLDEGPDYKIVKIRRKHN